MSFLEELKRRRVVRVAIVYAAVAFGVLQAADVLVPALHLPEALSTAIAVLAILGFPIALVLAWAFDIGPGGVRRAEPAAGGVAGPGWVGRGTLVAAGVPLLLGIGLGAGWFLRPMTQSPDDEGAASIAALPFESLSSSEEDGYFTDGIHDEILTQLSRIGSLRVISRTSVMPYRDSDRSLTQIAEALGARYILEGSVRRGGDQVRITAQLIDSRDDSHLWAETYDRSLDDVLAIQSEVATRIADALHATLTPEEMRRIDGRQETDPATYDLYLRATGLAGEYGVRSNNERSIELYRQAIERDPEFAPARAGLAYAYASRVLAHGFPREWADSGLAVAERAVALDPTLAEAHVSRAFNLVFLGRLREARESNERAIELSPNAADAIQHLAWMERELGRFDVAIRYGQEARRLDPGEADIPAGLGSAYRFLGDLESAARLSLETLAMQPANPWAHTNLVYMDLVRRRYDSARDLAAAFLALDPDNITALYLAGDAEGWAGNWEGSRAIFHRLHDMAPDVRLAGVWWSARLGLGYALHQLGREAEAEPILDQAAADAHARLERGEEYPSIFIEISLIHAIRGEDREAIDWLNRAWDAGWRFDFLRTLPHYQGLLGDPEFTAIVERIEADIERMRGVLGS